MDATAQHLNQFHDFFVASASVAGALIGLLFVAISVAPHHVAGDSADPTHRIRASAALTAFTNALTVSLLALIPSLHVGTATVIVASVGLLFVAASLLSLLRARRSQPVALREASFLVGLLVLFVAQLTVGVDLSGRVDASSLSTLAILTVFCFLAGISRAWELIGAPSITLRREVIASLRKPWREQAPATLAAQDDDTSDNERS